MVKYPLFPRWSSIHFFPNRAWYFLIQKIKVSIKINYVTCPSTYRLIKCWFLSTLNKKFIKMKEKNNKFFNNWFKLSKNKDFSHGFLLRSNFFLDLTSQGQGGTDHIKLILEIFFDHSIIDSQSLQKIQKQKCLPDRNF